MRYSHDRLWSLTVTWFLPVRTEILSGQNVILCDSVRTKLRTILSGQELGNSVRTELVFYAFEFLSGQEFCPDRMGFRSLISVRTEFCPDRSC